MNEQILNTIIARKINKIEKTIEENGVFIQTESQMNMNILEDSYESIEDEIMWLINYAKQQLNKN